MIRTCAALFALSALAIDARGQSSSGAVLAVLVGPECAIDNIGQNEQTLSFRFKIRTGAAGGQIVLRFAAKSEDVKPETVIWQTQLQGPGAALSGSASLQQVRDSGVVIAQFGQGASSTRTGASGTVEITSTVPLALLQPVLSIACR